MDFLVTEKAIHYASYRHRLTVTGRAPSAPAALAPILGGSSEAAAGLAGYAAGRMQYAHQKSPATLGGRRAHQFT
jgi:hypothetical protein